jgi:hypothetical protein
MIAMQLATIAIAASLAAVARAQPRIPEILSRVTEEAEVLRQNITRTVTQETLEQRTVTVPGRFQARTGDIALRSEGQARVQVREVVSEYTIGALGPSDSPNLLEFRQVTSVDGHPVQSVEAARHALSLEMRSPDDRLRKRMLEDFARHGLVDVATDYAMILLAFTKRGLEQLQFGTLHTGQVGTEDALVLDWQQTTAAAGQLEFRGKHVARRALHGRLWVRRSDNLPLRIQAWSEHSDSKTPVRDEATIEYAVSPHGFLAPASVVHRHIVNGGLVTENLYRYEPFRLFTAETQINFSEVPDPSTLSPARKP